MSLLVRDATADDLAGIVALTSARRAALAAFEPVYWNPRAGIDETNPVYLAWCIETNGACEVFVSVESNEIVGCVFAHRRTDHVFVDDFCIRAARWADIGPGLLAACGRPALICAPAKDTAQRAWLSSTSARIASLFLSLLIDPGDSKPHDPVPLASDVRVPPRHVFGTVDPTHDGALLVSTTDGYGIGSPPALPPAYDPGGPTTVVDRIVGVDRGRVLEAVIGAAAARGDVQIIVVADATDAELADLVLARGATQPVDLWEAHHP